MNHLASGHHVTSPEQVFLPLFDGRVFTYRSLAMAASELSPLPAPPAVPVGAPDPQRRVIRKRATKRKASPVTMTPATSSNACILCGTGFNSSEEVQRHLLSSHVGGREQEVEVEQQQVQEQVLEVKQNKASVQKVKQEEAHPEQEVNVKEEVIDVKITPEEAMLDDEMDEESDIEIDEEHYSINHVEVNIEDNNSEPLNESDFCPVLDDGVCIEDEQQEEENPGEEEEDEEHHEEEEDEVEVGGGEEERMDIVGEVGKAPVYLRCEVCSVVLPSILHFTNHMRKLHKDSEQEKNKPYSCDICGQGFYFLSSRNSHQSKAHRQTTGVTFR